MLSTFIQSILRVTPLAVLVSKSALALIDVNSNTISDVWEAVYGDVSSWDEDLDHDGFSNQEEALAGTDPHDPRSFPSSGELIPQGNAVWISRLPTIRGILYKASISGDLKNWHPVADPVVGTGKVEEIQIDLNRDYIRGGAIRSRWDNLAANVYLVTLIEYAKEGTPPPTTVDRLERLDMPYPSPHELNYGQWIRGWLIPPETGSYIFWLAANDISQFYLSTTSSPEDKRLTLFPDSWAYYQEWDKFPSQRSSPIVLQAFQPYYFELYHRQWDGQSNLSLAWTRPSMPEGEKEIIGGKYLSSNGKTLASVAAANSGQFYIRWEASHLDSDNDGVADYEEYLLGLDPFNPASFRQTPDAETARERLSQPNVVTISALAPRAYEKENEPARVILTRTGGIAPLNIRYQASGTALPKVDYHPLSGQAYLPAGQKEVVIEIIPIPDDLAEPEEDVTVTLLPGDNYLLGTPSQTTVTVEDAKDIFFTAQLRSLPNSPPLSSGFAAIRRSGNGLKGNVRFSYQALSGLQPHAELLISDTGMSGTVVLTVDLSRQQEALWVFEGESGPSTREILEALEAGKLWARIKTSKGIELVGNFQPATGHVIMPPPPMTRVVPTAAESPGEAARFLAQATFGPTPDGIRELLGMTYEEWINRQFTLLPTLHLPYMEQRWNEILRDSPSSGGGGSTARMEAWWQRALTAPDQLRQRMAFALSEIFVMSQQSVTSSYQFGSTKYYDLLVTHAFGNFRELLGAVTTDPMMGLFLGVMRNKKSDPSKGTAPDENYAREVMQLFTIGLNLLNQDGSLVLDEQGMPIPAYTQKDVTELAAVLTGWGPHWNESNPPRWSDGQLAVRHAWYDYGVDELRPMSFYPEYHDTETRTIVGNKVIPASSDGKKRLKQALDALFEHPNVGPFIARQLIQRFVTSNPSPGYVYRVASAFNDNGSGVRGDLKAVIKAILLDPEARDPLYQQLNNYGKPSEPLIRVTRLYRAFPLTAPLQRFGDPRYFLNLATDIPEQRPLMAPSVFNFFQPDFSRPGLISQMGLHSPEFQILTELTATTQANTLYNAIHFGIWAYKTDPESNETIYVKPDFSDLVAILNSEGANYKKAQGKLLDYLNDILLFGNMSDLLRSEIQAAFDALPSWFQYEDSRQLLRAQMAVYLIVTSSEFFVQR